MWVLVDDFETGQTLQGWTNIDVQNDTDPHVPHPQVSVIRSDPDTGNHYMLKKPAADGVVGNRKAIGFTLLPVPILIGETYTLYSRISVEYFPTNQSFGLSNVSASDIPDQHYDSFEPMIRIADKRESDRTKNDGALMVLSGAKTYSKIINPATGASAEPLAADEWYELWYVVNNAQRESGGQRYDLYLRGGEFATQQPVFVGADFRMQRTTPLTTFMAISNTGRTTLPTGMAVSGMTTYTWPMAAHYRHRYRNYLSFNNEKIISAILSFGPGIFAIGYTIGTGSVTSMIVAGSTFGMDLSWVLLLSCHSYDVVKIE